MTTNTETLLKLITETLDDRKAKDIKILDVKALTSITEFMVVCSGTSNRHVSSISDYIVDIAKKNHAHLIGIEGKDAGEWVLVDLDTVIVHIMLPRVREFYQLEKLWDFQQEDSPA